MQGMNRQADARSVAGSNIGYGPVQGEITGQQVRVNGVLFIGEQTITKTPVPLVRVPRRHVGELHGKGHRAGCDVGGGHYHKLRGAGPDIVSPRCRVLRSVEIGNPEGDGVVPG